MSLESRGLTIERCQRESTLFHHAREYDEAYATFRRTQNRGQFRVCRVFVAVFLGFRRRRVNRIHNSRRRVRQRAQVVLTGSDLNWGETA
jgi:hypothetical protein